MAGKVRRRWWLHVGDRACAFLHLLFYLLSQLLHLLSFAHHVQREHVFVRLFHGGFELGSKLKQAFCIFANVLLALKVHLFNLMLLHLALDLNFRAGHLCHAESGHRNGRATQREWLELPLKHWDSSRFIGSFFEI